MAFFHFNLSHISTIGLHFEVRRNTPLDTGSGFLFLNIDPRPHKTSIESEAQLYLYFRKIVPPDCVTVKTFISTMASQQIHYQTKALKRPSSSFDNVASGQASYDLPFSDYAIIFIDQDRLRVRSSPSIREKITTVLTAETRQNFLMALDQKFGFQEPVPCCMLLLHVQPQTT